MLRKTLDKVLGFGQRAKTTPPTGMGIFRLGEDLGLAFIHYHDLAINPSIADTQRFVEDRVKARYPNAKIEPETEYIESIFQLATTWDRDEEDEQEVRAFLKNPTEISAKQLEDLFAFLFASSSKRLIQATWARLRTSEEFSGNDEAYADAEIWRATTSQERLLAELSDAETQALFEKIITFGLYPAFNEIACDTQGRFTLPHAFRQAWVTWRDHNKANIKTLYPKAVIEGTATPPSPSADKPDFYRELHGIMAELFIAAESNFSTTHYQATRHLYGSLSLKWSLNLPEKDLFSPNDNGEIPQPNEVKNRLLRKRGLQQQAMNICEFLFATLDNTMRNGLELATTPDPEKSYNKAKTAYRDVFNQFTIPELHQFFETVYNHGMIEFLERFTRVGNAAPRDFAGKYNKWKSLAKTQELMSAAPKYAGTTHTFKSPVEASEPAITLEPATNTQTYTIAEKQAFFDGAMLSEYFSIFFQGTNIDLIQKTGLPIRNAMSGKSIKIRQKEGLLAALKIQDPKYKKLHVNGIFTKLVRRTIQNKIEVGAVPQNSDPHALMQETWAHALNHEDTRTLYFKAARDHELLPDLYFLMNAHDSYAPAGSVQKLEKWCTGQGINLPRLLESYPLPDIENIDAIITKGFATRSVLSTTPELMAVPAPATPPVTPVELKIEATGDEDFYRELHDHIALSFEAHDGTVVDYLKRQAIRGEQFIAKWLIKRDFSDAIAAMAKNRNPEGYKIGYRKIKVALLKNTPSRQQAFNISRILLMSRKEIAIGETTSNEAYSTPQRLSLMKLFIGNLFKDWQVPDWQQFFQAIYDHGMMALLEEHLKVPDALPKEFSNKYNKWKNLPKTQAWMNENPPKYAGATFILPRAVSEEEQIAPAMQSTPLPPVVETPLHSIADKQAFFDGVEPIEYLSFFKGYGHKKASETGYAITKVMAQASKKTQFKTGLQEALKLKDSETRQLHIGGLLIKLVERTTNWHIREHLTGSEKDPHGYTKTMLEHAFKHDETLDFYFRTSHEHDLLPDMYFLMNAHDTYAPEGSTEKLRRWCEQQGIDLDRILDEYRLPDIDDIGSIIAKGYNARNDVTLPPAPIIDVPEDLGFIPVEGLQIVAGHSDEPIAVDTKRRERKDVAEKTPVNHVELIKEKIGLYLEIDGPVEVYGSAKAAERVRHGAPDYELKIIQFRTKDGQLHQIATNDWIGSGTHIIKPPVHIDTTQATLIEVADLRANGSSWPIRHKSDENYLQDITHHCKTPKAELEPYLPRFYGWSNDHKIFDKTIDTCAAFLRATGQKIASCDRRPFEHGALRGLVTPSRVFHSLVTIGFKDRAELYDFVFAEHPDLEAHVGKPAVKAKDAFNEAADMIAKTEIVPQQLLADDFEICGKPLAKVSEFFSLSERGCVIGWKSFVSDPAQQKIPPNWDEFMLASGLAVRQNGALEPNWQHPELMKRREERQPQSQPKSHVS